MPTAWAKTTYERRHVRVPNNPDVHIAARGTLRRTVCNMDDIGTGGPCFTLTRRPATCPFCLRDA